MRDQQEGRKRVFVSFDFDNNQDLKHLFIGQSRNQNTNFDLADFSLKEAKPSRTWEMSAKKKIAMSQLVIVLVGSRTHRASGVLKEIQMARDLHIPIVQVRLTETNYPRVEGAGRLYNWTRPNLEKLFSRQFRPSKPIGKTSTLTSSALRRSHPLRRR